MSKEFHNSDCAVYNEPYMKNGPCNCGFETKELKKIPLDANAEASIDEEKQTVYISEYGEHVCSLAFDEVHKIRYAITEPQPDLDALIEKYSVLFEAGHYRLAVKAITEALTTK